MSALDDVATERTLQDAKWGEQNHPDGTHSLFGGLADSAKEVCALAAPNGLITWTDILLEEVYEALAESDPTTLREELVQVAAVAVAWAEAIDRRPA